MSEVIPTASTNSPNVAVDVDSFGLNLLLTQVFQQMLKKPDADSEGDGASVGGSETSQSIAAAMAQSVTAFGL